MVLDLQLSTCFYGLYRNNLGNRERRAVMNAVLNMLALYKAKKYSINCVNVKLPRSNLLFELIH